MIEICCVGGFDEVGKNMTAVKYEDEVVIFDIGLHLDAYIKYTEDEELAKVNAEGLIKANAVPEIGKIKDWWPMVKAIVPSHAHLDHLGAIPYLAPYIPKAEILGSPFSIEVLKAVLEKDRFKIPNIMKKLNVNSKYKLSKNLEIEFMNITHSTPQTVMVVLHTPEGAVVYANDYKFDLFPTLGLKPNLKKIRALGDKRVAALISDSTYARLHKKTPSELVAKQMLKDVMLSTDSKNNGLIITTFSSHIARLKTIIELGKKLDRKIVFCGRSLARYVYAAEIAGIINFSKDTEILQYRKQIDRRIRKIMKEGKEKYLIVVTGHQGEPKATLSRMAEGNVGYDFDHNDIVIFSCNIIPTPLNHANREVLDAKLVKKGVRLFKGIHTSGHASREDMREMISMLKPDHVIPAHAHLEFRSYQAQLAEEMGYEIGKNVHLVSNGGRVNIEK